MKESEMHNLKPAWQYAKAGYEYMHFMMNPANVPTEEGQSFPTNTGRNLIDLDEKLLFKKKQVLLPFSNTMVHCKTWEMQMQGYKLHVMTHAPFPEDKSGLPNGVYILKTYTELKDGSRNVSMVLRNLTSKTIHLAPVGVLPGWPQPMRCPKPCPHWNWLRTWMRLYQRRPQSSRSRSDRNFLWNYYDRMAGWNS